MPLVSDILCTALEISNHMESKNLGWRLLTWPTQGLACGGGLAQFGAILYSPSTSLSAL